MEVNFFLKKVKLNPRPWRHKWDRKGLNGVIYPEQKIYEYEQYIHSHSENKPFNKYDMMKHYRETLHDDDHKEIIKDIEKIDSGFSSSKDVDVSAKKIIKTRRIPGGAPSPNNVNKS